MKADAKTAGSPPTLSVVIVNWHSKDFVRQCLASLHEHCTSVSFEVIVVDGASFDGCERMLADEYPAALYIQSPTNLGFARANNLGVRHSRGQFLALLNPDTKLHEDSFGVLLRQLEALPSAGLVGCKLLNGDGSMQTSCIQSFPTVLNQVLDSEFLRSRCPRSRLWGMAPLYEPQRGTSEVEVISGACMVMPRRVFEAVGGFTEKYFMYGEDVDLCYKIRSAGWHVHFVPDTTIVHFGGGSTSGQKLNKFTTVMMQESKYRFLHFNRSPRVAAAYRAAIGSSALIRMTMILPLLLVRGNSVVSHGADSLDKWLSIFRWSVGLERWVCNYL